MSDGDPLAHVPAYGVDGTAFPMRGSFGAIGKVATCDARFVELKAPMGHTVRLRRGDVDRGLGGPENAAALLADAKAHDDAVTIRFDSTGVSYTNTQQFLRFERAVGHGESPPYNITDMQRRSAGKEAERRLQRLLNREFRGR